jgi:hypothetical protein
VNTHEREKSKEEVPQGLPRATLSFYSICGLHRWPSWQGSKNLAQETFFHAH